MPLPSGSRLGAYEITHVLGAGGMGEVYRARDSRLGRSVAIKVILESFATDADRVARFEREAKVLASINHPNIAALYGMEEANGQRFLVMELVDGETLADRLQRGPLPIEDALRIALQIAEALEAAHEKSIIHRDLKPANVKITPDDKVKVLDFGLAKAIDAEPARDVANSPTLSMMATNAGIILGTAAYMSPEQAKGFSADHRSDVFAFGIVLYEMLTGRQPFQGETAPDILASVLVREPELQRLPADLNPRIQELLRRCLEKSPRRRWQAIGDLRAEIEAVVSAPRATTSPVLPAAAPKPLWRRAIPIALASAVTGLIAALTVWQLKPLPPRDVMRFPLPLPDDQVFRGLTRRVFDISPDGRQLVYAANAQLYLRPLSSMTARPLQGTGGQALPHNPVFSPDNRHVAYYADLTIKTIGVSGGPPLSVCQLAENPSWITWAGNDQLVFAEPGGVMRVSATGGTPEKLISTGPDEFVQRVQLLPGGDTLLLTISPSTGLVTERWEKAQIVAHSLRSGTRTTLLKGSHDGWYLPTGHLAYVTGGTLHAVEFDLARLEVRGQGVPLVEGIRRSDLISSGVSWFSVSSTGTLAYVPGPPFSTQSDIAIADLKDNVTELKLPPAGYEHPRVSRDGSRLAVGTDDGKEAVVRIYDLLRGGALQRLTFGGRSRFPAWTSDGRRVAFQSDRQGDLGIYWQATDRTSDAERLTTAAAGESHIPESWHPDGYVMLFSVLKGREYSLWTYSLRDRKASAFADVRSSVPTDGVFSPDGKWVAYSARPGLADTNIYVQPFPPTGAKYELPRSRVGDQPHHPVWSFDRKTLIFNARPRTLDVVSVTTTPTFAFGNAVSVPRKLLSGPPEERRKFDMMPDGSLIGLIAPGDPATTAGGALQMNVVLNWFDELKARFAAR